MMRPTLVRASAGRPGPHELARALVLVAVLCLVPAPLCAAGEPIEIAGRVLDAAGRPLAARVALRELVPAEEHWRRLLAGSAAASASPAAVAAVAETEEDGGFRLAAPAAGMWQLRIESDGRAPREIELVPLLEPIVLPPIELASPRRSSGPTARPEAPPPAAGALRLSVRLPDGGPAAGALAWSAGPAGRPLAMTGADGGLTLPRRSLPAATPVTLRLDGRSVTFTSHDPPAVVHLESAVTVAGRVVDERGRPVAGAWLWVEDDPGHAAAAGGEVPGTVELDRLPAGVPLRLAAAAPGHGRRSFVLDPVASGRRIEGVRFVLSRGFPAVGRVLDLDGRPLAGAQVRASPHAGGPSAPAARDLARPEITGRTDARGLFRLPGLVPGRYDLEVVAPDHAPALVRSVRVATPAPGLSADLGTIRLEPDVRLTGIVTDAAGVPLPASLEIFGEGRAVRAASDGDRWVAAGPDGRFEVTGLRPGERLDLRATAPGFADARLEGVEVPPAVPVELVLAPAAGIFGRVLTPEAAPVSGARVTLVPLAHPDDSSGPGGPARRAVVADGKGGFHAELAAGRYRLQADAPGWQPSEPIEVVLRESGDPVEVELSVAAGVELAGRVLGAGHRPVAGARVEVRPVTAEGGSPVRAVTADDGRFGLTGPAHGPLVLSVEHDDHRPYHRRLPEGLSGLDWVEIELARGLALAGTVRRADGRPVAGARVVARMAGEGAERSTTTDGTGAFRLGGLASGEVRLRAEKPPHAAAVPASPVELVADLEGLDLVLGPGVDLSGRLSGVDWDDLARLRLGARGPSGESRVAELDATGEYRFTGLGPGRWRLTAELADGRRRTLDVVLEEGGAGVRRDLDLAPRLRLNGTVRLDRQPLSGALVELRHLATGDRASARTDERGAFEVAVPEPGTYLVRMVDPATGGDLRRLITIDDERPLELDVVTTTLSGRVGVAGGGPPLAGAEIRLLAVEPLAGDAGSRITRSRDGGAFRFERVPTGTYHLTVSAPGRSPFVRQVLLPPVAGGTVLDVDLAAADG